MFMKSHFQLFLFFILRFYSEVLKSLLRSSFLGSLLSGSLLSKSLLVAQFVELNVERRQKKKYQLQLLRWLPVLLKNDEIE